MKYLVGAAVLAILALLGWGLAWLIQDQNNTCYHWKQAIVSIARNDPQDLPLVLSMYSEDCDI